MFLIAVFLLALPLGALFEQEPRPRLMVIPGAGSDPGRGARTMRRSRLWMCSSVYWLRLICRCRWPIAACFVLKCPRSPRGVHAPDVPPAVSVQH